jgi:acid-sensing ion channel, other
MHGEKSLKFFKHYNKANCENELLSNMTVEACGCSQFFMPRTEEARICGFEDMKCYEQVEENFGNETQNINLCLKLCENLEYEITPSISDFKDGNYNRFIVKFRRSQIYALIRKQQFTRTDILAFIGGLLGR